MSEENTTKEIKLYELGYHLTSSISEDKVSDKVDEIKQVLSKNSAEVVKEGEPKKMDLAYEIVNHIAGKNQRFNNSYFGWIKFNATAEQIESIKEAIDLMDDVVRSLIIKTVDDEEHSTSKILNEEQEKEKEREDELEKEKEELEKENEELEKEEESASDETDEDEITESEEDSRDSKKNTKETDEEKIDKELDSIVEEAQK